MLLVTCPANGKYVPEFTINAAEIVELVEAGNENNASAVRELPPRATPVTQPTKTFEDPAILSVGKRPTSISRPSIPNQWSSTSMERIDSARTATGRDEKTLVREIPTPRPILADIMQKNASLEKLPQQVADLVATVSKLSGLTGDQVDDAEAPALEELDGAEHISFAQPVAKTQGKRVRKRRGRKEREDTPQDPTITVTSVKETTRSKTWKETPLLDAKGWRQTP